MVHHMTLPKGLALYSAFAKKLSEKEMNEDEAQLTWKLQGPILVLDVSCIHVFTYIVLCAFVTYLFFPPTDIEKCLKRRLVLVRKLRTVVNVKSRSGLPEPT